MRDAALRSWLAHLAWSFGFVRLTHFLEPWRPGDYCWTCKGPCLDP